MDRGFQHPAVQSTFGLPRNGAEFHFNPLYDSKNALIKAEFREKCPEMMGGWEFGIRNWKDQFRAVGPFGLAGSAAVAGASPRRMLNANVGNGWGKWLIR